MIDRLKTRLAAVALVAMMQLIATYPASAESSEGTGVASLIEIGLKNAPTAFVAIRGEIVKQNDHTSSYKATTLPDQVHYRDCVAYFFRSGTSSALTWVYSCNSTPRSEAPGELFKDIEPLVQSNVPVGYSSSGIKMTVASAAGSLPWETWQRDGSPDIILQVFANAGGASHYTLAVR